ncbi:unnamed protein product [Absidia cylindrospora]
MVLSQLTPALRISLIEKRLPWPFMCSLLSQLVAVVIEIYSVMFCCISSLTRQLSSISNSLEKKVFYFWSGMVCGPNLFSGYV